jgi:hypothetical protein
MPTGDDGTHVHITKNVRACILGWISIAPEDSYVVRLLIATVKPRGGDETEISYENFKLYGSFGHTAANGYATSSRRSERLPSRTPR